MRDIDLAELASDYDTFHKNTLNVLHEYIYIGNYKPSEVIEGRKKFLEDFDKRTIFSTELFYNNLENKAHNNIKKELKNIEYLKDKLKYHKIPAENDKQQQINDMVMNAINDPNFTFFTLPHQL